MTSGSRRWSKQKAQQDDMTYTQVTTKHDENKIRLQLKHSFEITTNYILTAV